MFDIPRFDTTPLVGSLDRPQDQGDGTLNVTLAGDYLPGTILRLGNSAVPVARYGLTFNAPAIQLATQQVYLVDRSGAQQELVNPFVGSGAGDQCLTISPKGVQTMLISPSTAQLTVTVKLNSSGSCGRSNTTIGDLSAVVGNKVFGLRDAPFKSRDSNSISFLLPASMLQSPQSVTVGRLLWGPRFRDSQEIPFAPPPSVGQAVAIAQSATYLKIALMGSGLSALTPILPGDAKLDPLTDSGAILTIPLNEAKGLKQLVLKDPFGELLLIAMPTDQSGTIPQLVPHAPVKAGQAAVITVAGAGLEGLEAVRCERQDLQYRLAKDKKSVEIDLPKSLTGHAGTVELEFVFKTSDTVKYSIPVYDQKIEITPSPPPK